MLKYVQVSPYRSSSALCGARRAECCDESPSLSSPSTPSTRLSSASSHAYTCSSASSSSCSSGVGPGRGAGGRADSVSLNSSMSCSSLSQDPLSSRSSSSTSLHDGHKVVSLQLSTAKTTVRVWVRCLMQEMEYKTVCVAYSTTCRELVQSILSKFKMKHRDPNLFYLTMEVTVRKTGGVMRTILTLEDDSRPAELQSCYPRGDSRLALKMRPGGLVRVYDGALVSGSQYKSLLVSDKTTCEELARLVLLCNNIQDNIKNFSIYEVRRNDGRERKLHQDERPLRLTSRWVSRDHACLVVRHTPSLTPTRAQITPLTTLRSSVNRASTRRINAKGKSETNSTSSSHTTSSSTSSTTDSTTETSTDTIISSTTITISPNGASTVTITTPTITPNQNNNNNNNINLQNNSDNINNNSNKSSKTCDGNNRTNRNYLTTEIEEEEEEEAAVEEERCPSPPLRIRRPSSSPFKSTAARRKLPWTQSADLIETCVDDENEELPSTTRTRRAHSYNDYENYFYI
ncbi:type-2 histone deacetylase 1-like [Eriocheir sinensis]|uniref:type-2 histone deacetylase 1-like n=1 Tax=Eriocheir sinensis TaxID=95602 RepID=UPI0021C92277|nr:type-2 histone deacetylase 1-like [Eriocheir sinensis]